MGSPLLLACMALLGLSHATSALAGVDPDEGYFLQSSRWTSNRIPVCWENGSTTTATEQGWVRDRVMATWDAASAVSFTGWGSCNASTNSGVRIRIADAGPRTLGLGKSLNNVVDGMLLNFTYLAWGASCSSNQTMRRSCIESNAIHEFGHALGIAHEQNRPDTDRSLCTDAPQGTSGDVIVGAWDRNSIMNYCFNSSYNNGLSSTDRATINNMYPASLVDFNGDGRSDVALVGGSGWVTMPVALSAGAGSFTVVNGGVGSFNSWAAAGNVTQVTGDFNNDGLTDVALVGGVGWGSIPVAFSNGDGTFRITNADAPAFAGWASGTDLKAIAGDFDGDGRTDIVLAGGAMLSSLPVAISNGDGSFNVTNAAINGFGFWASSAGVQIQSGDFNADGRTDLALTGVAWSSVPIAFSNGDGTFNVTNQYAGDFSAWSRVPGAKVRAADFNGDGRTDLAITGGAGWKTIPLVQSVGDGTWLASNSAVGGFADWSSVPSVFLVLGDFDRNRTFDLALTGGSGWTTLPVAFSTSPGNFSVINAPANQFASWASAPGVKVITQK